MASAVTLPTRRRRDSSEDLGAGSLGSIGGSAVGSSVEENQCISSARQKKTAPILKPLEGLEVQSTASRGSGSAQASPPLLSRRPVKRRKGSVDFTLTTEEEYSSGPLKKRKGSVDFSLALDDEHNVDDTRILPKLEALPSMEAINSLGSSVSPNLRGSASIGSSHTQGQAISALDYLDALGEEAGLAAAKVRVDEKPRKESMDSNGSGSQGTMASSGQRMLLDAFMSYGNESSMARRDRLESWGGMSDLSVTGIDNMSSSIVNQSTTTAAALASLANDVAAAANFGGACNESVSSLLAGEDSKLASVPSKICLEPVDSSDPSASLQLPAEGDLSSDLQAFVKKAMASVGNQLAELATAVESAVKPDAGVFEALAKDPEADSDMSSAASLMIGATSDAGSKIGSLEGRSRSLSITSALNISVDYDAVAAAVNAAEAAAGAFDLSAIVPPTSAKAMSSSSSVSSKSKRRRQLPTKKTRHASDAGQSSETTKQPKSQPQHVDLPVVPISKVEERDMEEIRERARAAAGYVPPSSATGTNLKSRPLPPKKRAKRPLQDPRTPEQRPSQAFSTPRMSNATTKSLTPSSAMSSGAPVPSASKASASKGQSGQKWDSMFDCLLAFIGDRRVEETQGLSDKEKKEWIWDGNVPTTFKTKDGKALGRWVNNQRSAKSKGVLKEEREDRLVKAGLKWSVLASNSWNEMLEELRLYVAEQTKAGRKWDGNVPTNYRIKTTRNGGKMNDEDKNLGRWVNRQRSLYQAGKLRSDRQRALEEVGLKWSMLATTSWESMFETLCEYVRAKTPENGEWDGNVPANYRTSDNPPRALGRWINRQRSAYVKDKLKSEYVEKLNSIGLKWSVHERRPAAPDITSSSSNAKGKGDISNISGDGVCKKLESVGSDERKGDAVPDDQPSNAGVDAAKCVSGKEDDSTVMPTKTVNSAMDNSATTTATSVDQSVKE